MDVFGEFSKEVTFEIFPETRTKETFRLQLIYSVIRWSIFVLRRLRDLFFSFSLQFLTERSEKLK